MSEARSKSVIVFVDTKKDSYSKMPTIVQKGLSSEKAGRFIPKVVVTDTAVENSLAVIPYETLKSDAKKAFREVFKTASGDSDGGSGTNGYVGLAPRTTFSQENWTSADGRTIRATFVRLTGDDVTLTLANGKAATLSLDKFAEDSQKRAKELGAPPKS